VWESGQNRCFKGGGGSVDPHQVEKGEERANTIVNVIEVDRVRNQHF